MWKDAVKIDMWFSFGELFKKPKQFESSYVVKEISLKSNFNIYASLMFGR